MRKELFYAISSWTSPSVTGQAKSLQSLCVFLAYMHLYLYVYVCRWDDHLTRSLSFFSAFSPAYLQRRHYLPYTTECTTTSIDNLVKYWQMQNTSLIPPNPTRPEPRSWAMSRNPGSGILIGQLLRTGVLCTLSSMRGHCPYRGQDAHVSRYQLDYPIKYRRSTPLWMLERGQSTLLVQ